MPAKAGIQYAVPPVKILGGDRCIFITIACVYWVPAFAGTTDYRELES